MISILSNAQLRVWDALHELKAAPNSNLKPTKYYPSNFEGYLVIYNHLLTSYNICNRQFKRPLKARQNIAIAISDIIRIAASLQINVRRLLANHKRRK